MKMIRALINRIAVCLRNFYWDFQVWIKTSFKVKYCQAVLSTSTTCGIKFNFVAAKLYKFIIHL